MNVWKISSKKIEYESDNGYRGILYNLHNWYGELNYQMSIYDEAGNETLHTFNASPHTLEELKDVVDNHPSMVHFLKNMAETGHP